MPATQEESSDNLSLLQKQLILSQVQILELEDVRDELQTAIDQRTKLLKELQTVADRTLAEAQQSRAAEANAQHALHASRGERHRLQLTVDLMQREADKAARRLTEIQTTLDEAKSTVAAQIARIETLDAEVRKMKASRSWRWMAPLRSLERLLR